jgi:hypothetical protein
MSRPRFSKTVFCLLLSGWGGLALGQWSLPDPTQAPGRMHPMLGNDTRPFQCIYGTQTQEGVSLSTPETRLILGPYAAPCHGAHHLRLRDIPEGRFTLTLEREEGGQWQAMAQGPEIRYEGAPGNYRVLLENTGPAPRSWRLEAQLPRSQIRRP